MKNTLLSEWITNLFRADIYIILSFRNEESFNISFFITEKRKCEEMWKTNFYSLK